MQKKKGAPAPLPHDEEDCPNAPSAPIPGALRLRTVPALDPISCASRAGQSHQYYTVHEALYRVKHCARGLAREVAPGKAAALTGAGHTLQDGIW